MLSLELIALPSEEGHILDFDEFTQHQSWCLVMKTIPAASLSPVGATFRDIASNVQEIAVARQMSNYASR